MSTRYSYKILDLFCGEGLAAWGYWRSGCFSEIVGVDLNSELRDRYSFDFVCGDAIKLDYEFLFQFDFIHASPPCQAYSKATPKAARASHMRLIAATHLMCHATGLPYVIENVENSTRELRPNLVMNGHAFGLPMERRRYFYVSALEKPQRILKSGDVSHYPHGTHIRRDGLIDLFGLRDYVSEKRLSYLTKKGIEQGIPPVMTNWIARRVIKHRVLIG